MDSKYHVTCLLADNGNGVGVGIIYQPYHIFVGFSVSLACIDTISLRYTSMAESKARL